MSSTQFSFLSCEENLWITSGGVKRDADFNASCSYILELSMAALGLEP
jgi:hypothetical protein